MWNRGIKRVTSSSLWNRIIKMRAIVWTAYGPPDVLQLKEVEKPVPKADEVLVRIRATTVTAGDCEQRGLKLPFLLALAIRIYAGLRRPKRLTILGMELAGEIEAVGRDVTRFTQGDQVFAATGFTRMGSYAEYICLPENPKAGEGALAIKPDNLTWEEAAAVPVGGQEALHFIRQANIRKGQKVLINGAGGTIGTYAVQLARHFGAEVTAVDSTGKLDLLRSIGADHVVDYTRNDFTKNGEYYDVILDVAGRSPFSASMKSLTPNGRYLLANPGLLHTVRGLWASKTGSRKVTVGGATSTTEDLTFLKGLIEAGTLKPAVDRTYPLEQIAEAHRYVETGEKRGHVVITV